MKALHVFKESCKRSQLGLKEKPIPLPKGLENAIGL